MKKNFIFIMSLLVMIAAMFQLNCDPFKKAYEDDFNGAWELTGTVECETFKHLPTDYMLQELWFRAKSSFSVTYDIWEAAYYDYWGCYSADQSTQMLTLDITGGNYIPEFPLKLKGSYEFITNENEERELVLYNMWLGAMSIDPWEIVEVPDAQTCGLIFSFRGNAAIDLEAFTPSKCN